jgi:hypothetical protein
MFFVGFFSSNHLVSVLSCGLQGTPAAKNEVIPQRQALDDGERLTGHMVVFKRSGFFAPANDFFFNLVTDRLILI